MATTDLSYYDKNKLPDAGSMRIGIVVSEWNNEITQGLLRGCLEALQSAGANSHHIHVIHVPGSFELPAGAQMLLDNKSLEAVICLGCVIQGETKHFEFVCNAVATGVMDVSLKYKKPVIFGVLTDDNIGQSRARSGGALGNKGVEAAVTAVKMIALQRTVDN